jgi:hypothetical protein
MWFTMAGGRHVVFLGICLFKVAKPMTFTHSFVGREQL